MKTLCKIRNMYRSIAEFEIKFEKEFDICLNAGMLLCSLEEKKKLSSGEIAKDLGLTYSNTSKVIKSIEEKGLIKRKLGKDDKRQMYFTLTKEGEDKLNGIRISDIEIPAELMGII